MQTKVYQHNDEKFFVVLWKVNNSRVNYEATTGDITITGHGPDNRRALNNARTAMQRRLS